MSSPAIIVGAALASALLRRLNAQEKEAKAFVQTAPSKPGFLQENKPAYNLSVLSNPKYMTAPDTSAITREAYRKTPWFKAKRESVQKFTIGAASLYATYPIWRNLFHQTVGCMALKDWQTNFFSTASECFTRTVYQMASEDNRLAFFFRASLAGFAGLTAYVALRALFRDSTQAARVGMLQKEYALIGRTLNEEGANSDPAGKQKIQALSKRVMANLPLIKKQLVQSARLELRDAEAIASPIERAARRIAEGGKK